MDWREGTEHARRFKNSKYMNYIREGVPAYVPTFGLASDLLHTLGEEIVFEECRKKEKDKEFNTYTFLRMFLMPTHNLQCLHHITFEPEMRIHAYYEFRPGVALSTYVYKI